MPHRVGPDDSWQNSGPIRGVCYTPNDDENGNFTEVNRVKVTVERMPGSVVNLDISADPDEFSAAVDKTIKVVSRQANIQGFRPGKAPRHIVLQRIGRENIVAEAGRNMMDDLYQKALDQENLKPIAEPMVDIVQEEPLNFRVVVEVFPEVELNDYKSVRVEPREVDVDDEEVEEQLEALRKNFAEWVDLETPRQPKEGDQITIDLEVYEGDEEFQEPGQDAVFVLGESNLFEALEEAIRMMMPGATSELTLAFEEDDTSVRSELRGKTLRYNINLKEVKTRELPELDDEFAGQVGDFETIDEMMAELRSDTLRGKAQQARGEVINEIFDAFAEETTVTIPKTMIDTDLDDAINQLRSRLAQQGMNFETYLFSIDKTEEAMREDMRPDAERRVRNTLVLQEIGTAEELEVTDEDIEAEIEKLTEGQQNPEQMQQLYRSDYFRGLLQNEIQDRKLTDFVVELATEGQGPITGPGAEQLEADEVAAREAAADQEAEMLAMATATAVESDEDADEPAPTQSDEDVDPDEDADDDDDSDDDDEDDDEAEDK